jgi:hypothetical protein
MHLKPKNVSKINFKMKLHDLIEPRIQQLRAEKSESVDF